MSGSDDWGRWAEEMERRLDRLEARINLLFGALGVLTVIANAAVAVAIGTIVK